MPNLSSIKLACEPLREKSLNSAAGQKLHIICNMFDWNSIQRDKIIEIGPWPKIINICTCNYVHFEGLY